MANIYGVGQIHFSAVRKKFFIHQPKNTLILKECPIYTGIHLFTSNQFRSNLGSGPPSAWAHFEFSCHLSGGGPYCTPMVNRVKNLSHRPILSLVILIKKRCNVTCHHQSSSCTYKFIRNLNRNNRKYGERSFEHWTRLHFINVKGKEIKVFIPHLKRLPQTGDTNR